MSEKLDGCRVLAIGGYLYTRGGNIVPAPAWFLRGLPEGVILDAELYCGRGHFEQARLACQYGIWNASVRLMVFDLVEDRPFDQRLRDLGSVKLPPQAKLVSHIRCEGLDHLRSFFDRITSCGGEGVMLRAAGSHYDQGRSPYLLKVKPPFAQIRRAA
jgi:DNA ligase-1